VTAGEKVTARTGSWIEPRGRPRGLGGNGAAALSSGCVEIYYTLSKKKVSISYNWEDFQFFLVFFVIISFSSQNFKKDLFLFSQKILGRKMAHI